MQNRDITDIIGGLVVTLFGGGVVGYGLATMSMGSLQRMGPGFFPVSVGVMLMLIGIAITIPALFREGTGVSVDWRALVIVPGSLACFALALPAFGLAPAIFILVAVSTFAQSVFSIRGIVLTAAFIALACYLVFDLGLGLGITMFRWPF